MRRLSAAFAAVFVLGWASADAADLPGTPAPSYTPVYRPLIYDWTGFYVGAHIGTARRYDAYTDTTTTILEPAGNVSSHAEWGTVGGGQIGVNYQMTPVVVGVEGTWSASSNTGATVKTALLPSTTVRDMSTTNWFATATVRAGYAFDRVLLFVKGGAAWQRTGYQRDVLTGVFVTDTTTTNNIQTGWTVGAGLEWGITENLSAKLEYDYLDFGTSTYTYNLPNAGVFTPVSIQSQTHMITGGLNYRFTWGGGGSVASTRY